MKRGGETRGEGTRGEETRGHETRGWEGKGSKRRGNKRRGDEALESMRAYPEEKIRGPGCWFSLALAVCIVWFGCCCLFKLISVLSGGKLSAALNLSESFRFARLKHFQDVILCSSPASYQNKALCLFQRL